MIKKPLFWIINGQFVRLSFMTEDQIKQALQDLNNLPINGGLFGSKVNNNQWRKAFIQELSNRNKFINNLLDNNKFHVNSIIRNKFKKIISNYGKKNY